MGALFTESQTANAWWTSLPFVTAVMPTDNRCCPLTARRTLTRARPQRSINDPAPVGVDVSLLRISALLYWSASSDPGELSASGGMKRNDLIRHLERHGCQFLREGGKHNTPYADARRSAALYMGHQVRSGDPGH